MTGTFNCPLCGRSTPHEHTALEQVIYRNGQKSGLHPTHSEPQRDSKLFQGLRELCGYVEDSSQEVLQISQDDATREWCLSVGKTQYLATSFRGVIDEAINANLGAGGTEE